MSRKTCIAALVSLACGLSTAFNPPVFAYMAEKVKLDQAAADCDAGKYKEGAEQFRRLGNEGDAFAQYIMGVMYQNGRGVPKNVHSAIGWYMKSAKQGYPGAEERLGEIYQFGEQGIKKDNKQAADWYRRAAHHGNQKAQMALFKMFISSHIGNEVAEARAWLGRACQTPGELSEDAHKAFANLPAMKEMAATQNNFENEFADMAVAGTMKPAPGQTLPVARPVNTLLHQPDGLVGALEDHWGKVADLDKSLSAAAGK
ncbi:MAG: sel1 repeat family protein [Cyanobacteria bacterium SZAS LIN-3]|nr:sel1 repeat family protein [Cyanobacteria bacterium SZAS LIN-3]